MKINGLTKIKEKEINNITGGFGNDEKCILVKDVAILHDITTSEINQLIKRNMLPNKNNFIIDVDLIDLKLCNSLAITAGYSQDEINASKNIWLLSQRGYIKLVSAMSNTNTTKWEVMNNLIDEYFMMKEQIKSISEEEKLQLAIFNADSKENAILASADLDRYRKNQLKEKDEIIQIQKPKAEYHDKILNPEAYKKLITTTVVAKDLGTTANKLNKILKELGVQYKRANTWLFTIKYDFLIKEDYADYNNNEFGQILKWTEKGRQWIIDLLNNNNLLDENYILK